MRLPRVRFSLRALMVLVLVIGGVIGWTVHRARVQRDAIATIKRAGGSVAYDWQTKVVPGPMIDDLVWNPIGRPWWPSWLDSLLGPDYFCSARIVG
jgi:hypothetical protein